MAINGDIARIADLLGQIGGIVDEFRFEVGVLFTLAQNGQVNRDGQIVHGLVEKTGMATFVTAHILKDRAQGRIFQMPHHLGIEQTAAKLSRTTALKKFYKLIAHGHIVEIGQKFLIPAEVILVVITGKFVRDPFQFGAHTLKFQVVHLFKVSRIKTGAEYRFFQCMTGRAT